MPVSLPNTSVGDAYPAPGGGGAQVQGNDEFYNGWFTVANNAVIAEFNYGVQGQGQISPEIFLAPGTYPLSGNDVNPLKGIRFRNALPTKVAQIWGAFFYKNDPLLLSSAEFTAQISSSGGTTPPVSQVGVQHNNIPVAFEQNIDFLDLATGILFTVTDDPVNSRVKLTPVLANPFTTPGGINAGGGISAAGQINATAGALTASLNIYANYGQLYQMSMQSNQALYFSSGGGEYLYLSSPGVLTTAGLFQSDGQTVMRMQGGGIPLLQHGFINVPVGITTFSYPVGYAANPDLAFGIDTGSAAAYPITVGNVGTSSFQTFNGGGSAPNMHWITVGSQ